MCKVLKLRFDISTSATFKASLLLSCLLLSYVYPKKVIFLIVYMYKNLNKIIIWTYTVYGVYVF